MKFTVVCFSMMVAVASANFYHHPIQGKDITIPPVTCPPCVCTTPTTTTTTTTTTKPTTTRTTTTTTTTTTTRPTTTTTTPKPPADPAPLCSDMVVNKCGELQREVRYNQLLPYPGDCSRFCQCTTTQALSQKCATGLQFNLDIQTCDWPAMAKCSVSRTYAFYL